jgi:DNA-binding transcriptional ArsR family regulator
MPEPADTVVIDDPEALKVLGDPLRRRILGAFAREPKTTKQVSIELGVTSNKLYHHVDLLMEKGLLRLVETKPKRGTTEKYLQAVARRFIVQAPSIGGKASDSGLAEMVSGLSREVQLCKADPDGPDVLALKAQVRLTQAGVAELQAGIEELVRRLSSPKEGESYSVTLLALPLETELD